MATISKILLTILFFPAFFVSGFLYGVLIAPFEWTEEVIWEDHED